MEIPKSFTAKNTHIISDYDGTISRSYVNGKRQTSFSVLEEIDALSNRFLAESKKLYEHYHPLEKNRTIPQYELNQLMEEWWTKKTDLMVQESLSIDQIKAAGKLLVNKDYVEEFYQYTAFRNIPVLVLSAGMGSVIEQVMPNLDNVHLISNEYQFSGEGKLLRLDKIIHTFNKNESNVKDHPYAQTIKNRKNVILIGDSLGDLKMKDGLDHEEVFSIGFYNGNKEDELKEFKKIYDYVIQEESFKQIVSLLLDLK